MNIICFRRQVAGLCNVFVLLCLLFLIAGQAPAAHAQPDLTEKLFDNGIWWIEKRDDTSVPIVQSPMTIFVNGTNLGTTYQLSLGHRKEGLASWPEIAAIYNTGYLRLVPFDLPWGTSFVLGPAYWEKEGNLTRYFHNIQISRVDIDTSGAASRPGSIQLTIQAQDYLEGYWPNYHLSIVYNIIMPDPDLTSTKLQVREVYTVANPFALSLTDQSKHQGFKWVQFSSMYVDENFHDSDSTQYQIQNGNVITADFKNINCDQSIFAAPQALSTNFSWVEVKHSDNLGWRGNTPNAIIIVNNPAIANPIVPQGNISLNKKDATCKKDPTEDNIGVWLNRESAPQTFNLGDTGAIEYTLISQDDPLASPQVLSVSKSGNGAGTVISNPIGINCGSDCSEPYIYNTNVTLTASAATGSTFAGWIGGGCSGTGTCNVTMTVARSITASFISYNWYIRGQGSFVYGMAGDVPVVADYNGDGRDDIAIFRPSTSMWYVREVGEFLYGAPGDIPVVGDYNGDGRDDIAIFRPSTSTWYIRGVGEFLYGASGDIPVVADYNGDGRDDIAIFRPSTSRWYIRGVGDFLYGAPGDMPVIADYNGDRRADIAVFRPSTSTWYIYGVGDFLYGAPGDMPVIADYNGDGRADIAVFRPSNSTWYLYGVGDFLYGARGDIPVIADYSGDKRADIAIFRP